MLYKISRYYFEDIVQLTRTPEEDGLDAGSLSSEMLSSPLT